MPKNARIEYLFQRYLQNACTAEEKQELFSQVLKAENDADFKQVLDDVWQTLIPRYKMSVEKAEAIRENILKTEGRVILLSARKRWYKIAVAAAVLIAVAVTAIFVLPKSKKDGPSIVKSTDVAAPDKTKATITLADGRVISLDSLKTINQNGVELIKTAEGNLVYSPSGAGGGTVAYNTLTNPRGSKVIDMQLSDGSHVWLNAGSSVTYPIAFIGNERKVSITGEAYFEASPSPSKGGGKRPFIVENGKMQVIVLGTKFNVNAYDDESDIKVTLLEGSVKVRSLAPSPSERAGGEAVLKPGQQARVSSSSPLGVGGVDVDAVMAWKNGSFQFYNASINDIMRQVARWYDVEVVYESTPTKLFRGGMPRTMSAANVFKVLEETGGVQFRIEGRKVYVRK